MTDPKVEALRQTLQKYEAGELNSDLFDGSSAPSAGSDSGGEDDYAKARAAVLRKLTGSAKSRHQLAQALREREFNEQVITSVLDRMEEVQLIDDAEFARTWVRTRHELKGLGAAALRRELQDKGVSAAHIESALEQLSVEDENAAARALIEARLRGVTIPVGNGVEDRKEREKITRRLVGMLGRRGHAPGAALQLVREALESRAAY
ncbi:regulatory protein RecX [Nesterenkonia muleiensis]|uniref:regulatory protein RecX n=1 Tax=Nesterenkonia muleiensis TaxID=2282648 RepID=UPI000E71C92D|nr:regulatory protein RecX [Nesterenkonia muleiensis]